MVEHDKKDIEFTAQLLEDKRTYDSAIQQNRPELFLSRLPNRGPLQGVKITNLVRDVPRRGRPGEWHEE